MFYYLTKSRILELREAVLNNEFVWTGDREIVISKAEKKKNFIPLGIAAINDRLVQEVIRSIIEPIFEFGFSNNSQGFRPNRSCHTALKSIKTRMKDSIWFIEGDLKSYFPTIHHEILMKILELKIQYPRILKLIRTGLKAKIFQKDNKIYNPKLGTPQGGIISPLLSNIYLDKLDKYMEELCDQPQGHVETDNCKNNPLALRFLRSGQISRYIGPIIPNERYNQVGYCNFKYLRYADDFVIGVLGPHSMAIEIRDKVKDFLKEKLDIELSMNKTKITHVSKDISFLGYKFSGKTLLVKQTYHGKKRVRKITIPTLDVNMIRVIARLSEANFCKRDGTPIPAFRFLRLPQSETNKKVNYILRGLSEWWCIAGNRRAAVARVAYIIKYSVAKVYAAKFKLKTVAAVFKIGGNSLANPIGKRIKSVVGADYRNTSSGKKVQLTGILYDRYYKIPKPQANKLKPNWTPEHVTYLAQEHLDASKLIKDVWKIR
uniref:Reverse transcriptase n=1 Tax=Heterodermia speciosa TaxID=116794 RepID=A0A3G2Z7C3_9LECA|nr:reverse transcriptase [Heterodermia speciosa]AYP35432.1 reverse transcriptase [Heterodermia speciosa]